MKIEVETPSAEEARAVAFQKLGPKAHISVVLRLGPKRDRVVWVYSSEWQEL